jgi:hypothetical protein
MPLFDFELLPLSEVPYWDVDDPTKPTHYQLNWYQVTVGKYAMNVGSDRLFQFSSDFLDFDPERGNIGSPLADCAEYFIVQVLSDVLETLPDALAEIPPWAFDLVSTIEKQRVWSRWLLASCKEDYNDPEHSYCRANDWLGWRMMPVSYLNAPPSIWFFRHQNHVHIRWDNTEAVEDGIARWAAQSGEHILLVEDFLSEVESFHARLISAMEQRITLIRDHNPLPRAPIHIGTLFREHAYWQTQFSEAKCAKAHKVDWGLALAMNKKLGML